MKLVEVFLCSLLAFLMGWSVIMFWLFLLSPINSLIGLLLSSSFILLILVIPTMKGKGGKNE